MNNLPTVYHFRKVDNDTNGNPQWVFNLFVQSRTRQNSALRVIAAPLGRFSKKYDGYIIKYYGNEDQAAKLIENIIEKFDGYTAGKITL